MKYKGSKWRIAKHILPIILKDREKGQFYVEPFCGGCNVIDKVDGNRIANDNNQYLIEMLRAYTNGVSYPDTIKKEDYLYWREQAKLGHWDKGHIGWVLFMSSYDGRYIGYKLKSGRDKIKESISNINKQSGSLKGIDFRCKSYTELGIPYKSIIYCDPPKTGLDFDVFYDWCRVNAKNGHKIFISKYIMPSDFICVWEGKYEKLYTL